MMAGSDLKFRAHKSSTFQGDKLDKKQLSDNYGLQDAEATVVKHLLLSINKAVSRRLDVINERLETVIINMKYIEDQFDVVTDDEHDTSKMCKLSDKDGNRSSTELASIDEHSGSEEYPDGSYLGEPCDPAARIRVPVTPSTLSNICSTCDNPHKMALTLLDYLFDRRTQAVSSLRGGGMHGKKKLDERLVEGIRLHLVYIFDITVSDWQTIRLSIDSKCRAAYRRKSRGLKLYPRHVRSTPTSPQLLLSNMSSPGNSTLSPVGRLQPPSDDDCSHPLDQDMKLESLQFVMECDSDHDPVQYVRLVPEQIANLTRASPR